MALISSVVSEDFCDAFVRNNRTVSYVLKGETETVGDFEEYTYHFIINGTFWSSTMSVERYTLELNRTHSKSCPLFTDRYYTGDWVDPHNCVELFSVIIKNQFFQTIILRIH